MFTTNKCPPGEFCIKGQSTGTKCLPGTFNPMDKRKAISDCIPCDPGYYCDLSGMTQAIKPCDAGYWCKLGSSIKNKAMADAKAGPCIIGSYCPSNSATPILCPPGKFCSVTILSADEGNCDAGYYCVLGAKKKNPTHDVNEGGNICPDGHYCPAGSSAPIPCDPGTFRTGPGATVATECLDCTAGNYCESFGAIAVTGLCQKGYYCEVKSTVKNPKICTVGNKCPDGAASQTACSNT